MDVKHVKEIIQIKLEESEGLLEYVDKALKLVSKLSSENQGYEDLEDRVNKTLRLLEIVYDDVLEILESEQNKNE